MPVGTILPFQGNDSDIPEKWHLCDGTNGTPNLTDGRFLEGSSTAKNWHSAGLPNITGEGEITVLTDTSWQGTYNSLSSGAISPRISISENRAYFKASGTRKFTGNMGLKFDASKTNSTCASIYRNDVTTVQPKSYTVRYIMKIKA